MDQRRGELLGFFVFGTIVGTTVQLFIHTFQFGGSLISIVIYVLSIVIAWLAAYFFAGFHEVLLENERRITAGLSSAEATKELEYHSL